MKKLLKILGIIFVILIIVAIAGGGGKNQNTKDTTKETKSAKEKIQEEKKEVVKVEINSFIKDFDSNQLAAEKKYEGKVVEVSGYIRNISEDITGKPFLSLIPKPTGYFGTSIQCFFDDKEELTTLKNGQKVTVKGDFKAQELGIIMLEKCTVVK